MAALVGTTGGPEVSTMRVRASATALLLLTMACATSGTKPPKEADPEKDPRVLMQLGDSAFGRRAYGEATSYYQRSLAMDPNNSAVHNKYGIALMNTGRLQDAEAAFRKALGINPDFADVHNNLGTILDQLGRRAEAKAEIQKAIDSKTYSTPHTALFNLGRILLEEGENDAAVQSFRRATEFRPDFGPAALALGMALQKQGRLREACAQLEKCAKSFPEGCEAVYQHGTCLWEMKQYETAARQFEKVVQTCPGSDAAKKANEYLRNLRER